MFHCNGWCFPWAVAERAGVNVCLRRVEAKAMWDAIREHGVTHMCGAPIVYTALLNAPAEMRQGVRAPNSRADRRGRAARRAARSRRSEAGVDITHVYGLTENYGPGLGLRQARGMGSLPLETRRAEQPPGRAAPMQEGMVVLDPETMQPVPWDGETIGEIMFRGNITMKGYLSNPTATERRSRAAGFTPAISP